MDDTMEKRDDRFRIMVCIDGSDESYLGVRYAAMLGHGVDADIVLLYIRPVDQGLRSGGLQVRVARENMLNWGLELPGTKYLQKGRDLLIEMGEMSADWEERSTHTDVAGDPLGDNKVEYTNPQGKKIVLKLKVASDIVTGILEQWETGQYDLIILGKSERGHRRSAKAFWDPAVAEKVATHAPCSVLMARGRENGRGHLIYTDGSKTAEKLAHSDSLLASCRKCSISILSVADDEESKAEADRRASEAQEMLGGVGINVQETLTRVGDPVREIVEAASGFSLTVVADSDANAKGIKRFFKENTPLKVMEQAQSSVMIIR